MVGPTATGKSDCALDLAERLATEHGTPVEIVSADAYQQYIGMDIGTAKVPVSERRGIPHHQYDVLSPWEDSTVADYQLRARQDIAAIQARGGIPIVVGGSGLYVRALLDVINFPGRSESVRAALEERAEREGSRSLFDELERRDIAAATTIGPHNTRRIIRALEVMEITGQPYSANLPREEYVQPAVQIGLRCQRDVLVDRVEQRVRLMDEAGLFDEVAGLASPEQGGTGPGLGVTASRAVGYAEVLPYLRGECTRAEALEAIAVNTRQLARRQMTWFRRDQRITWLDALAPDLVEQALERIR